MNKNTSMSTRFTTDDYNRARPQARGAVLPAPAQVAAGFLAGVVVSGVLLALLRALV